MPLVFRRTLWPDPQGAGSFAVEAEIADKGRELPVVDVGRDDGL